MRPRAFLLVAAFLIPTLLAAPPATASSPFAWGSDLAFWSAYDDAYRNQALDLAVATGMPIVGVDAKSQGPVGWGTSSYPTYDRYAPGDGPVERVVRDAHARGLRVMGRFDVFEDDVAASRFPGAVIGGTPRWVDPACPEVRAYVLEQMKELVARVPLDEINFDHVRYPDTGNAPAASRLPCTGGTLGTLGATDRAHLVASWIAEAAAAARAIRPGIQVTATVYASTMIVPFPEIGQDAARIAPHVDLLRPMAYPTYLYPGGDREPYKAVYDFTRPGVVKYGGAKVQPWIQGIDVFASRSDLVCEQMRAVVDAGATGALVWWFWSTGTGPDYWRAVAACTPARPPPPPPPSPPPTARFEAAFHAVADTVGKVEVRVVANAPLAQVEVHVDGGAATPLRHVQGDLWSAPVATHAGSLLQFAATSTDGQQAATPACVRLSDASPAPCVHATFEVTLTKRIGTRWKVDVTVDSASPVRSLTAHVNGQGSGVRMYKTEPGAYTGSVRLPGSSTFVLQATLESGAVVTSAPFAKP